jgi:quinol monooxygenase YgiN
MSPELFVFGRFHAREGREQAVAGAIRDVAGPTRAESGCIYYGAYRSFRDPRLFFIHSHWTSEAAFDLHAEATHTVRFIEKVKQLIDHELDVNRTGSIL